MFLQDCYCFFKYHHSVHQPALALHCDLWFVALVGLGWVRVQPLVKEAALQSTAMLAGQVRFQQTLFLEQLLL